jgi:hypothetical protein
MSICKLSFAKSRSVVDPARGTGASEIPRNEAYKEVRRSASGPEGLRPGGTRDEGNAALRCFDLAQGHELVEWQMAVFRQTRNYSLTRVTYSPVRVSTVIFVPSSTKGGTRNL